MMTKKIKFTITFGLLFLPLISLIAQSESVGQLKMTIDEQKAQIEKLKEEKQKLQKQLNWSQKEIKNLKNQIAKQEDGSDNTVIVPQGQSIIEDDKTALVITDPLFKDYLLRHCDMDNDGVITTWDAEHTYVIDCSKEKKKGLLGVFPSESPAIYNLDGIEAYINLKKLVCSGNEISRLDLSHNTQLETLVADGCGLAMLNINENTELKQLSCKNNALRDLDVNSNPNLTVLDVSNNELHIISLNNNKKLTRFYCANNQLASIMASNNVELRVIDCSNNKLTSLDLSNTSADSIMCQNNSLGFLDVHGDNRITYLDCRNNNGLKEVIQNQGQIYKIRPQIPPKYPDYFKKE